MSCIGPLNAQSVSASPRPAPDDHTLSHLFFIHHDRQSQDIENIRPGNPQQADAVEVKVAAQYKITVAELVALNKAISPTSQKLQGP